VRLLIDALRDDSPHVEIPWEGLRRMIAPVPGNLILIAGAPGAGKSIFTLAWLLGIDRPTRLVSLDTDPLTQASRLVANLTGRTTSEVLSRKGEWAAWLEQRPGSLLLTDRPPTPPQIGEILEADTMAWGEAPAYIAIDDVEKMRLGARGFTEWVGAYVEMHQQAKRHGSVVLGIHHMRAGDSRDYTLPPRRSDLQYAPDYEPEIVLGIWRPRPTLMRVSILKNRMGEDNPNGHLYCELRVDMSRCYIEDVFGSRDQAHDSGYSATVQDVRPSVDESVLQPDPFYDYYKQAGVRW
jgi:hypothetical protein